MLIPASALAAGRARGAAPTRAAIGCALLGAGVLTLAFLPSPSTRWLVAPLILAGSGIGLALPALAGELLPERTPAQAARLLALRHAAIALSLLALAPLIASQLQAATDHARLQGVAALLDSPLNPTSKLALAPALTRSLNGNDPRQALARVVADNRATVNGADQAALTALQGQGDAIIVEVGADSLRDAFLITGALGLLAAMIIRPPRRAQVTAAVAAASLLVPAGYAVARATRSPSTPTVGAACHEGSLPAAGGISGLLQDAALTGLNGLACSRDMTREQLVLSLLGSG
jgi:hypothetical protein